MRYNRFKIMDNMKLYSFYFLIILIILGAIFIFSIKLERKSEVGDIKKTIQLDLEFQKKVIINHFDHVKSDLLFLLRSNEFHNFIDYSNEKDRKHVESDLVNFSIHHPVYDQIRLIDENGNEMIRINNKNGNTATVDKDMLQNKKNRYYFSEAIKLNSKDIYVSPIDLNMENNVIETPIKPMIRFATPVFDSHNNKRGIIVLNYLASNIISDLKNASLNELGKYSLLNSEGFWLYNDNPEVEWGFMYNDKTDENYLKKNPVTWEEISNNAIFQKKVGIEGLSSVIVNPYVDSNYIGNEYWVLLNTVNYGDVGLKWSQILYRFRFIILLIIIVDIISAYILLYISFQKEKIKAVASFPRDSVNPVLRISKEGLILYANEASNTLLKLFDCNDESFIPEEWQIKVQDVLDNGVKDEVEIEINGKYYLLYLVPLMDLDYVNIYGLDITELKRTQEQLAHSQKMESIGQLAGGIAHEFNNLLSGIMGSAQLLRLPQRNLDIKCQEYTDLIIKSSLKGCDLTDKILAFGRKKSSFFTKISIHEIIDNTVEFLNRTLDKNISFYIYNNARNFNLMGDHSGLETIIMNLCLNARDALSNGGLVQIITENIYLNQSYCDSSSFDIEAGEYCKVSVTDSGSGIHSKNIKRIFEPFFTTKEQGKGPGLGLSAVYGIIQDHSGEVLVESEYGVGTSFFLLLPC